MEYKRATMLRRSLRYTAYLVIISPRSLLLPYALTAVALTRKIKSFNLQLLITFRNDHKKSVVTRFTHQHTICLTSCNCFSFWALKTSFRITFDNEVLDAILATPINMLLILNRYESEAFKMRPLYVKSQHQVVNFPPAFTVLTTETPFFSTYHQYSLLLIIKFRNRLLFFLRAFCP